MSTEWTTTDLMPPDAPEWATLFRQVVKVRLGGEIYRRGEGNIDAVPAAVRQQIAAEQHPIGWVPWHNGLICTLGRLETSLVPSLRSETVPMEKSATGEEVAAAVPQRGPGTEGPQGCLD